MQNNLLKLRPLETDLATLLLRLIFGGLFIYHGWQKIEMYDQILPMFTDIIGIGSKLSFNLLIFAEFFCGILIAIGLFTRVAVLPIMFSMGVAFFIAHEKDDFMKKELAFVFLLLSIPVFIMGSGLFSADAAFRKKIKPSRL